MTSQQHRSRLKRSALATGAALTVVVAGAGAAPGAGTAADGTAGKPKLKLIAASNSVTLDRWEGEPGVYLDLGTYVTVDDVPLEFKVTRKSYKDPVVAQQIIRNGSSTQTKTLPAGLVKDFSGLPGFLEVSIKNAAGEEVSTSKGTFCPNNASGRIRPDAPATSKYPESCPTNPFTLGSVWGVEKGWASNSSTFDYDTPVDLPAGEYTAKVAVAKKYRDLFGIPDDQPTIKVTVRQVGDGVAKEPLPPRCLPPSTVAGTTRTPPTTPPGSPRPRVTTTAPVAPTHPPRPPCRTPSRTAAWRTTWETGPGTPTARASHPR